MKELELGRLISATTRIANLGHAVKQGQFFSLPERDYEHLATELVFVLQRATELDMAVTAAAAKRLQNVFVECATRQNPGFVTFSIVDALRLAGHCKQLTGPVGDEIGARLAFIVPPSKARYYDPATPLFGKEVADKFPNYVTDMSEAGNCFALGRNTACVFHLMRVMEAAVQAFGAKLGLNLVNELSWQNILDRLNPVIRAMDKKDPLTKIYSSIQANLYHVKVAWRNEVMHPKATYDEPEAQRIINAVQAFLSDLVRVL